MWPCKWLLGEIMWSLHERLVLLILYFRVRSTLPFGVRIPGSGLLDPAHTGCWEPDVDIFSHWCAQWLHKSVIVGAFTLHHGNKELAFFFFSGSLMLNTYQHTTAWQEFTFFKLWLFLHESIHWLDSPTNERFFSPCSLFIMKESLPQNTHYTSVTSWLDLCPMIIQGKQG